MLRKTWAELLGSLREMMDEPSPTGFFTDATLLRMANRAKDRVWGEVRKAHQDYFAVTRSSTDGVLTILGESYDCAGFAIAASTRDYTLPPDCAEPLTIECITASSEWMRFSYRPSTDEGFRRWLTVTEAQEPEGFLYTLLGERTLRIAPPSTRALDLRITYIAIVPDLTTPASTLEMPHSLYRAVEEYTCASALMSDRAPEAAAFEARGNRTILDFLASNERQSTDPVYVRSYLSEYD